jgi:predicted ATPase
MWELRAATGLARLRREAGRVNEARTPLAPVLGSFAEGLDTRDFIEGKAILDELT